jgi:hypothetical protein
MFRFIARHGLVRLIGGRAVPALLLWDLAMLANRARQIPVVERNLRRGVDAAGSRVAGAVAGRRPRRGRRGATPDDGVGPERPAAPPGYGGS